ncbi:unnamed protein product [Caretta caretta]
MELSKEPRGFAGTWVHQLHSGFDSDMLQYKGYPEISVWLLVGSSQRYCPVLARMDNHCCSGDNAALPDIPASGTWVLQRFDPERVLGTISSVVAFFGLQAGKIILMYHKQPLSVGKRFLIWAVLLGKRQAPD